MSTPQDKQLRRVELVRRLAKLAPKHRLDAMLDDVDGRSIVQSIPAEDVYATIIEVGLADSTEVVRLATPEQFRSFVDLAAWQKDRMDPIEVLHWLRAARGDDDDAFNEKVKALDLEVLELIYKKLAIIHDLEEDPDANTEGVVMETPDNKFLIEFTLEGVDEAALRRLTFDLIAKNPFELSRFLEAVRWELPTEIEEAAFQFRQARLQDLGFPPLDEAMKVFAWVDPDKSKPRAAKTGLAVPPGRVDFVASAFKGLDANERDNLQAEVRYLVNCVLVAECAEPGDPDAIRRYSEHARDYLDLGLEHLTGGDAELASDVVRDTTLRELFQLGFSLTLRVKREAEKLLAEPGTRVGDAILALDDELAALKALLRKRPLKALKVAGAEPVPFRSRKELVETTELFSRVRHQRTVLQGLLGADASSTVAPFGVLLTELTPQRLLASVVARAEVNNVIEVAPFPAGQLQELCARIFENDGSGFKVRESAGQRARALLSAKLGLPEAEVAPMVQRVLASFANDFGATWAKDQRVEAKNVIVLPIAGEVVV